MFLEVYTLCLLLTHVIAVVGECAVFRLTHSRSCRWRNSS